jgi:hypothetical protein
VTWSSDVNATFAAASGSPFVAGPPPACTLTSVGTDTARCRVLYTPGVEGPQKITGSYGGDATTHATS